MPSSSEHGFTLPEVVIGVALLCIIAGSACETLAEHPAQTRSTAVRFGKLVAQARSLASLTDGGLDGATGATIGVVRDGTDYVATLYRYRPVVGAPPPQAEPDTPSLRTSTRIELVNGTRVIEPPFALFVGASGHASSQAGFTIGSSAPLAVEPSCPAQIGIRIAFAAGADAQTHAVDCETAQLDLDPIASPQAVTPLPRRVL